ncbi:MAG: sulfotransferase [Anaerolineae bacterium]|nr:sulfotransferase [Anaerolineae bacterium]
MNKPIFILGAHKSGSSLLRSLLDGHPSLFTIPLELHMFRAAGYWVDYRLTESRPSELLLSEASQAYLSIVEQYNARHKPLSDANLVGKFDMEKVREYLCRPKHSFSELAEGYVHAVHAGLHGMEMPEHLRIVEKSVENAEFVLDLKAMYPDAKFLHIVRNPYAHLVSLRLMHAQHSGRRFPFLGKLIESLNNSTYHLYRNNRLIRDYMVVRYEDLLIQPMQMMKQVADFLEIEFNDILVMPTSLGQKWQGNSSRGVKVCWHFCGKCC